MLELFAMALSPALANFSAGNAAAQQEALGQTVRLQLSNPESGIHLVSWEAGEVTCNSGVTFSADTIPTRIPEATTRPPDERPRVIFNFTLGSEGRALSIEAADIAGGQRYGTDLSAALAAARFTPQERETECTVTFAQTVTPYDDASLEDLVTLVIHSRRTPVPKDAWQRFVPGDCFAKRRRQLEIHTPDYRKLPKAPGANRWVVVSYDIDKKGRPTNLQISGSSGNRAVEAASRKAVKDSRWIDGDPRTGCLRYDWTAADVVEAPVAPPLKQYGDSAVGCDADDRWSRPPVLKYPEVFRRRGIEGWVVLRYDVATWGEIGNVEVLDAQPAKDFGRFAREVLSSARFNETETGLTGCLEKVVFRLPENGTEPAEAD